MTLVTDRPVAVSNPASPGGIDGGWAHSSPWSC
jgi:hypothetical protein